ncbi:XRE family transcriptional regulator [Colidextribacter sp. OB.20]|uniref:helix-turn-helix transcriptional regulator n=1 Tax=Colidextribacter sp. OB.20 TaxID=2304568 RepID=UPI00139CEA87|nr:XRE family transcriptional regulator [Colidextribacter sp. OB.20]
MPENFRNIYKIARRAAGYTQEAAAEMMNLSVESLRAYETVAIGKVLILSPPFPPP